MSDEPASTTMNSAELVHDFRKTKRRRLKDVARAVKAVEYHIPQAPSDAYWICVDELAKRVMLLKEPEIHG